MSGPDLIPAIEASQIARGMKNKVWLMWGGHHASALPDEIFNDGIADYVFVGPAEFTFPQVLNNPYWFGVNDLAGAVPIYPSSLVLMYGNFPCQILHECFP